MSDPRRQPIGSWQAIDEYWDEINGYMEGDMDMDATEADHNLEVSLERGNTDMGS